MRFLLRYGVMLFAGAMSFCSLPAMAYHQGDMVLRLGATVLAPNDKSSAISQNGVGVANSRVQTNSNIQAEFGLMYMFYDKFAAELKLSTPYQHRLNTKGYSLGGVTDPVMGHIRLWSPEVNLQWFPLCSQFAVQPYVGAGVHYAMFEREKLYGSWLTASNSQGSLSLKNRLGWNVQLGADWVLSNRWAFNAAVRYVAIETSGRVSSQSGTVYRFNLDLNPVVYTLGVSYNF